MRAEVGRKASFQSWRVSICDKVLTTLSHLQPPELFNGAAPRCYLLDGRTHQSRGQQVRETPRWRRHHCLVFPFFLPAAGGNGHRGNQRGKACLDLSPSPSSFITEKPCIIIYLSLLSFFFTAEAEKKINEMRNNDAQTEAAVGLPALVNHSAPPAKLSFCIVFA